MGEFPQGYQYGRPVPVAAENAGVAAAPVQNMVAAQTQIEIGNQQQQTAKEIDAVTLQYEQTLAQDALNRLRVHKDDLTFGEKNGFMNLKGGDVLQKTGDGQPPMVAYTERLTAASADVSKGLIGRARMMFESKAPGEIEAYRADLLRHTMTQADAYNKNVFAGTVKQAESDAVRYAGDPEKLAETADRMRVAATNFAKSQGIDAEPLIAELQSNVYKNAITSKIITGDQSAVPMFEKYKDKLDAKDRLGLEQSIKTMAIGSAAMAWVAGTGPTTEGAKAGTKASMTFWQGGGYSAPVAAGITAGFLRESQFSTGARNKGDGRDGSDSINIGQWNSTRAKALQEFAAKNGLDPNDVQTGLKYAKAEIDGEVPYSVSGLGPEFKAKLMAAKTEKEAADIMTRGYFRPKYQDGESAHRQQSASAILKEYGGEGTQVAQGGGEQIEQGSGDGSPTPRTVVPPAAGTPAAAGDGIVDSRRMTIEAEKWRLEKLTAARGEFGNNLPMLQAVTHQINAQFELRKSEIQLYKDQIYAGVQDWMTKGGPNGGPAITVPPANIFSQLTWEQQQSIERQVERNVAGKKTVTRQDVWYTIHQGLTSGNANERETWATAPLMQFKEHLSDQDFQELAKLQAGVRAGAGKELTQVQTVGQMVNSTLMSMGIDPTPKPGSSQTAADSDTMKAATFHRVFQTELTMLETAKGKKATPQEMQGILDGLVKQVAAKPGWLGGSQKPVALLTPADVPERDKQLIIGEIRRAGGVPTDERVLQVYQHMKATEPTQNEIPRPLEMPAVGTGGMGAGSGPVSGRAPVTGTFPPQRGAPVQVRPLMQPSDYSRPDGLRQGLGL